MPVMSAGLLAMLTGCEKPILPESDDGNVHLTFVPTTHDMTRGAVAVGDYFSRLAVQMFDADGNKVGDKVKIKGGDLIGEVMQVGGNWVNVAVGSILSKVQKSNVELISNNEYTSAVKSMPKKASIQQSEGITERKLNFKPSIDIRGERLMEALEIVTRFIDDALMVGIGEVKILHGKGNGVLKEEIRKYLKTVPGVVSCKDEDIQFGGSGITVVKMD
jgi:DNA mismatch repair protein MutS2